MTRAVEEAGASRRERKAAPVKVRESESLDDAIGADDLDDLEELDLDLDL